MRSTPEDTVRKYLDGVVRHDWASVADCLHAEVVRVGPFNDMYSPRHRYVDFLTSLMPSLVDYGMDIHRVVTAGSVVMAQLTETMEIGGSEDVTHEVLVFETDPDLLITRIDIFIQRPPA
jgi:SnoaL-like domain